MQQTHKKPTWVTRETHEKFLISVLFFCLNLNPWNAPYLLLVILFHLSWCTPFLFHPGSFHVFHNFSNNLPFTPSPLKATVKKRAAPHRHPISLRMKEIIILKLIRKANYMSLFNANGIRHVWAYQNDCERTGGSMKKGAGTERGSESKEEGEEVINDTVTS